MASNHIYHLGPLYCQNCKQFAIHYLYTTRPFFGVGPYSIYNLWMDAIKISDVKCFHCGNERKLTKNDKDLIKELKSASLISLVDEQEFSTYLAELIKYHDLVKNDSAEEFQLAVREVVERYKNYNIPYEWFENYIKIVVADLKRKEKMENLLYK